jgi:CheY-like chemotaxis protein
MERVFLIADDNPGKLMMLRGILHMAGWKGEVLTADSTEEAIEQIDKVPAIDAAFIDYYMPSENGPAVIRHLRMKFPEAKIALVSSADNKENAKKAREAGADTVLCTSLVDSEEHIKETLRRWREEWTA